MSIAIDIRGKTPAALLLVMAIAAGPQAAVAQTGSGPCSRTAAEMFEACGSDVSDNQSEGWAICINESDPADRAECFADVKTERRESLEECSEQREARIEVCGQVGEARYDPEFERQDFQSQFTDPVVLNSYLPIKTGNKWGYSGDGEEVNVEVLAQTKRIEGVTCAVVRDQVRVDGRVVENTDDWFAQANDGAVWYCGEESKDFEFFSGDRPKRPELVSIDGSFKAGRDGAKPGILFLGTPTVGTTYRQEFALGEAEDLAEVLSTTYEFGADPVLDEEVPEDLAELLCASGDCVVTRDFSPLSPGGLERKYYARGIGLFLETEPGEEDASLQIISCNVDPRCAMLPAP